MLLRKTLCIDVQRACKLTVVPHLRWNKIISFSCCLCPPLALLLMQSHKCHITSLRGTPNRNINRGKDDREKPFSLPLVLFFFPSANRLVRNPPRIRRDKKSLIGYIAINKHMPAPNGSSLQKPFFSLIFSLKIALSFG